MIKNTTHLILILASLFAGNEIYGAEELKFSLEKTVVSVNSLGSYQSSNYFEGSNETSTSKTFYFSISETEKLISKQGTFTINGRAQKIKFESNLTVSSINWGSVFNAV